MIFGKRKIVGTVALNLKPRSGPWGGAAQWAGQMFPFLRAAGWDVRFDLKRPVDVVLFTHTGLSAGTTFDWQEVEAFKARRPGVPVIHRVNDNDLRKGTQGMDRLLARANSTASFTVFVSEWLRDYHAQRWFDLSKPHSVIPPGAEPSIFHPIGNHPPRTGEHWRLVTHHWSPHWSKGFDVYEALDTAIANGQLPGFEFWFIGRWPADLKWQSTKTFAPVGGHQLAELLRQCHLYVTASRHEPGANHPVEGMQCGLPVLYHPDTGGSVTQCEPFGVEIGKNLVTSVLSLREKYSDLRRRLLEEPPSGHRMCLEYAKLIQRLTVLAREK